MSDHSRDYPTRIHAGHLGGGRRIWKRDLFDASERQFTCEYVRADVAQDMLEALKTCKCPLPAIGRPDDETVESCMASGSCGCHCGKAITKAEGKS